MNEEKCIRVLIVDDDESFRLPLAARLPKLLEGCVVEAVKDGEEAIQAIAAFEGGYDVALIDQVLYPPPDGLEVMRRIKELCPYTQAIMFTGWEMGSGVEALRMGAYHYMSKSSFDVEELAIIVELAAEHRRLMKKDLLAKVLEMSSALQRSLELDTVLKMILRGIQDLGYDRVRLYLLSEDDQRLVGRMQIGGPQGFEAMSRPLAEDKYSRATLWADAPRIYKAGELGPDLWEREKEDVAEWAEIPLMVRGRPIGKMSIDNKFSRRKLLPDELEPLMVFAYQAAIAIENAQLHRDTNRRVEELAFLNRVGHALVSSLELEQVLKMVMQEVADVLGVEAGSVLLLDDGGGEELVIEAAVGPWAEKVQGRRFPQGQGIAGWAAREGQPLMVPDAGEDPRFYPRIDEASGFVTRSLLTVPLQVKGKVIGVIEALNKIDGDFSQADQELLSSMALVAGIAIENARLYTQVQRNAQELEQRASNLATVQRASTVISSSLRLDEILNAICRQVVELFGVNHSGLVLFNENYEYGDVVAEYPGQDARGRKIQVRSVPLEERLVESKEPLIIPDVANEPLLGPVRDNLLNLGIQSILIVPLVIKGRVVGSFSLDSIERRRNFTNEEVELCQIIAAQAALAIENAQLYESEQERARRWRTVADAGKRVTQSLGSYPKELLEITAKAACDIVGADCAVIYPYYADTKTFDTDNYSGYGLQQKVFPLSDKRRELPGWAGRVIGEGCITINDVTEEARDYAEKMRFVRDEGVRAFVGMRLDAAGGPVGILYVNFRQPHRWADDELEAIRPFADQAALTIQHTILHRKLLEQAEKGQRRLQTAAEISRAFSSSLELDQVIGTLLNALTGPFPQAHGRTVELYDSDTHQTVVPPASYKYYWSEQEVRKIRRPIPLERSIGGWVVTHRKPANVPDVSRDKRYLRLVPETRSLVSVPIEFGDSVIGVLTLESRDLAAFDDEDQRLLETLADQAGVAIENARRYEKLKETQETLDARTAVAWTGLAGSTWFHRVRGNAAAIKDLTLLIRQKLWEANSVTLVSEDLDDIGAEVEKLLEFSPRGVLPTKDELEFVHINRLLREVAERLCKSREDIRLVWHWRTGDEAAAMANSHLLTVAVEMLVRNALQAMPDRGSLTIGTRDRDEQIEIRIADTGPGIPEPLQDKLFKQPLTHEEGVKGSGMGLLMAKTILEGYKGDVVLDRSGEGGTTFVISLPKASEDE